MDPKTITVQGVEYRVRYRYTREDGSQWFVLDTEGKCVDALDGAFGDEWPCN